MSGSRVKRERRQRTAELLAAADTLDAICSHIGDGGTLRTFCVARDIPYSMVADWLESDPSRHERHMAALGRGEGHSKDVAIGGAVTLATADLAGAYDPATNCLRPVHEIPEHIRQAIASVKTVELYEGVGDDRRLIGQTVEVRLWDKNRAIETLARSLKLLSDRYEVEGRVTLEQLIGDANQIRLAEADLPRLIEAVPARVPDPQDII